jgi:hypothetical protein
VGTGGTLKTAPLGVVAIVGLAGFALARTALMVSCHISQPWPACDAERKEWQGQMAMVGSGFWLLYTLPPGKDAP